ncbi:hypothetical protein, partial [Sedimentibacter sp. B4]|uniref:hypothetical protein n=1 Tax=Sedimentibacter sp. B4 TaxID=304766 RepID=UPI001E40DB85
MTVRVWVWPSESVSVTVWSVFQVWVKASSRMRPAGADEVLDAVAVALPAGRVDIQDGVVAADEL